MGMTLSRKPLTLALSLKGRGDGVRVRLSPSPLEGEGGGEGVDTAKKSPHRYLRGPSGSSFAGGQSIQAVMMTWSAVELSGPLGLL